LSENGRLNEEALWTLREMELPCLPLLLTARLTLIATAWPFA
jgi:hypothetical protein